MRHSKREEGKKEKYVSALGGIGNIAEIKIVFKKNKSTGTTTTTKATATAAAVPTITSRARWEEGKEAKVGKKISVE